LKVPGVCPGLKNNIFKPAEFLKPEALC